ncbi:hypothetical protein D3C75_1194610 [compost metagenome]
MLGQEPQETTRLDQQRNGLHLGCRGRKAVVVGKFQFVAMNRVAMVDALVILEHIPPHVRVRHGEQRVAERAINLRAFFV